MVESNLEKCNKVYIRGIIKIWCTNLIWPTSISVASVLHCCDVVSNFHFLFFSYYYFFFSCNKDHSNIGGKLVVFTMYVHMVTYVNKKFSCLCRQCNAANYIFIRNRCAFKSMNNFQCFIYKQRNIWYKLYNVLLFLLYFRVCI